MSAAPSIAQRNMAFGRDSITTASTSMTSSFTFLTRSLRPLRSFPLALASFFPKRAVVDVSMDGVIGFEVKELVVVCAVCLELEPTVKPWTLVAAKRMNETQRRRKDFIMFRLTEICNGKTGDNENVG